ncbi:alpha/beta hydrolase [Parvularcula sp. ZS-1/3]|uniref:Alpha/beta hydrolase n=1 Tax=Parvularcula mediterranea TaxID=2732508 RepID=A0A7Y3RJ47_9PROT|nr:alpha/beta hydrolase [Parvularcula mediterranea]NNU15019.1 alpha/beta hydrolase [Parvularcula mediterranea]
MSEPSLFVQRFGNPGPDGTLLFLHATGLNGSCYRPLLERLDFDGEIILPSMRGHGRTSLPANPQTLLSWHPLAADILDWISREELAGPLTLGGHSSGAITSLLVSTKVPTERVLMIEPVVLPRPVVWLANSPFRKTVMNRIPIAQQAAARRDSFASREKAWEFWRPKKFFRNWEEAAFAGYVAEGLEEMDGGVRLSCTPQFESAMFKAQAHGFWPHLAESIRTTKGVSILAAQDQTTFPLKRRPRAAKMGARVTEFEGGHMLPLEQPEETVQWLENEIRGKDKLTRV